MNTPSNKPNLHRAWLISGGIFAVLLALMALVWKQQVDYQRDMHSHFAEDVADQTSRGLPIAKKNGRDLGFTADLSVILFGLALSLSLSVLAFLLSLRIDMYRFARERALREVEERKKTVAALRVSDERHALLSRKAIAAQEEERARLSVDLHDELGQILTAIRLEMGLVEKQVGADSKGDASVLASLVELTEKATDELRGICKGLRPPLLDDLGLEPALQFLVDEFKERSGIQTQFNLPVDELEVEVPKEIALCTYRILQESLTNIRRHSKASNVVVSLDYTSSGLKMTVSDDGVGFDVAKLGELRGWGLEGMQERAGLVNGKVNIRSAPKNGTRINFRVPIAEINETEVT